MSGSKVVSYQGSTAARNKKRRAKDNKGETEKESHGLYASGDQNWGGAADNKAIHSMLRLHEDHTDTKIAQAGSELEQRQGG